MRGTSSGRPDDRQREGWTIVYVSAPGLLCPVGLDAESACAAMRAGIAQFEELPHRDSTGELAIGAVVPGLDMELPPALRLLELLAPALQETLDKVQSLPFESIPLIVCLAEPARPGGGGNLASNIIGAIERKLGVKFHPDYSGAIVKGHTAGFRALRVARRLLREGDILACLICAADSYINAASIDWLDRHWRLKTEENSDGVIPGECAAAALVTPAATKNAVQICGLGLAEETASIHSDEPLFGVGLTMAARNALADAKLQMRDIDFRLSDVTGESYGFKEQALALSKLLRDSRGEIPLRHCAESIGDSGAVAGICQLVVAHDSFAKARADADHAACYTSAVPGERAVAILRGDTVHSA